MENASPPLVRVFACAVLPLFSAGCFSCSGSGGWERVVNPLCREGYLPSASTITAPEPTAEILEEKVPPPPHGTLMKTLALIAFSLSIGIALTGCIAPFRVKARADATADMNQSEKPDASPSPASHATSK